MVNAITFDVEEWFQVTSFDTGIKISDWDNYESRVAGQTEKLLDILLRYSTKATFFILGYVAEKCPELIRKVTEQRHEVATHGHSHNLVFNLTPSEFEEELITSEKILDDISGQRVHGYRVPSFSKTYNTKY